MNIGNACSVQPSRLLRLIFDPAKARPLNFKEPVSGSLIPDVGEAIFIRSLTLAVGIPKG